MGRLEKRIFDLNDRIAAVAEEERVAREELAIHRHLHDDAVRDAAVSDHPFDLRDAAATEGDVARAERLIGRIVARRARLVAKRDALLRKL
jgi:hypothetical protein